MSSFIFAILGWGGKEVEWSGGEGVKQGGPEGLFSFCMWLSHREELLMILSRVSSWCVWP